MAGHGPSVQNPNQNPLLISFPKTIFLSLEAEMFKQLHGVFISQEGGSVQWKGSNLDGAIDDHYWPMRGQYSGHVISIDQ